MMVVIWHKGKEEKDKQRQNKIEKEGWRVIRYKDYIPSIQEIRKLETQ